MKLFAFNRIFLLFDIHTIIQLNYLKSKVIIVGETKNFILNNLLCIVSTDV
jgi:hypothetical protein